MYLTNKTLWFEGMFLQPQHFQQYDRYVENIIQQKHNVINNNYWGFLDLELDLELLSLGKIGIQTAKGIFPDGTYFNIPQNDNHPAPIDIPEGLNNTTLYLALPLKNSSAVEIGDKDDNTNYRYHVIKTEVNDNVASNNQPAEIQVGTLACEIISEHENLNNHTFLPICRISESRSNQQIALDKTFVTTWLDAHKETSLDKLIKEIHGLLNHRAEMLAGRLTDTQQAAAGELIDIMLLQVVNKYEPYFHYLSHKQPLHPEKLFSILLQLLGELSTFTNDKRRPIEPPVYQHKDLFSSFKPIVKELRTSLSAVLEQNATSVSLVSKAHGLWVGQLHDKTLLQSSNFVLAVYADLPLDNIKTLFPNQVKIAAVEQIHMLVSKALPGIPINNLVVAPRQIPYHANFCYFTINKNHELWKQLENSAGLALHVGSNIPGLKIELWAIK